MSFITSSNVVLMTSSFFEFFPECRKLRKSEHGQLLLNVCLALSGLYTLFLLAFYSTSVPAVCVLVSALMQYFFLVTFIAMAAEAINLYLKLVVVLGKRIHNYVLKAAIVSWGMYNQELITRLEASN